MVNTKYFLVFALFMISLSSVLALGVTAPYWDERALVMAPGETKDIAFGLQNMVGEEDVTLKAALISGSEIASLTDSSLDYLVPFGENNVPVHMSVSVPKDAKEGQNYTVGVSFTTVTTSESGQFQLGSAFEKYFDVQVSGKAPSNNLWMYVVAVVVVLLVIFFVSRNKKN